MSGFLTRLVTQSRGEATGIRPNLPPRFVPSPAAREPGFTAVEIDAETVAAPPRPAPARIERDRSTAPARSRPPVGDDPDAKPPTPEPPARLGPAFPEPTVDRDRIETAPTRRPPVVAAIRVDETPPAPEFHPTARHEPVADRRPPLEVIEERDVEAERPVVTPSPRQPAVGTQAAGPERVPRLDNERRPPAEPVRSFERPIPAATRFETDAETFQALEIARPEPRTVLRASLPERLRDRDEPDTPTRPESSRQVARGVASASPPRSTRSEASDAPADPPSPIETTVHVSIGRIEVRAVAPPSSTPKARPVSVAKSLNDYLHERARGAGR